VRARAAGPAIVKEAMVAPPSSSRWALRASGEFGVESRAVFGRTVDYVLKSSHVAA
jgi:hypothetical protein